MEYIYELVNKVFFGHKKNRTLRKVRCGYNYPILRRVVNDVISHNYL
jgi:hypothetical protein